MRDVDENIEKFIIYFHSHGSNRQEGRFLLEFASNLGMNLCLMDMRASGESGGKFTTLGIKEYRDVHSIIKNLQQNYVCKKMILFGRSMGAASLIKFVAEYKNGNKLILR